MPKKAGMEKWKKNFPGLPRDECIISEIVCIENASGGKQKFLLAAGYIWSLFVF